MKDIEKILKELEPIKKKRTLMTLSKMKPQNKIKKSEYQDYADCIRSDQVSAAGVMDLFKDKAFYKWYKKKYLNDIS